MVKEHLKTQSKISESVTKILSKRFKQYVILTCKYKEQHCIATVSNVLTSGGLWRQSDELRYDVVLCTHI